MLIDPITEVYIGFFIAVGAYVLVRFNIHPPICLCAMGGISFMLGVLVTIFSESPQNTMLTIAQNTVLFVVGNALGLVGGAIFEAILRAIRQVVSFFEDIF